MISRCLLIAALLGAPALAAPRVIPASDLLIRQTSANLTWRWRAPPETATQPALLRQLRATALKDAAKAGADAGRDAASAKKDGFPFRRYEFVTDWSLAADTPNLLALSGLVYSFTGGAHGNTGYASKIWDKQAKRAISIDALFTDWPRARRLIEPAFCRALAEEQKRRIGNAGPDSACPKLAEQPIVPWGEFGARAPQLRVLLGPYVAGSYAEGSYLITLPWPQGVKSLVKPAYRNDLFADNG
ncbi:MAG: hypothetical protein DCF31_08720 [Alphaproteobacteria bacterium]|nr:MAG: hypothetical protein DCF31_08720 [Alphaproteobacteria bacterium]